MASDRRSLVEANLSKIAREIESLRKAILSGDCDAIEGHSHRTMKLLEELGEVLGGEEIPASPAILDLHAAVQDCAALIRRVHRSVRALLSVHHSVSRRGPAPGVQF